MYFKPIRIQSSVISLKVHDSLVKGDLTRLPVSPLTPSIWNADLSIKMTEAQWKLEIHNT